jgi:PAS domain S-box-containing protein
MKRRKSQSLKNKNKLVKRSAKLSKTYDNSKISIEDLKEIKISEDAAREYAESIINTVREPLIVLNQNLRVVSASRSFYEFFKVKPEETMGQLIYDLGNKQWDIPKLRELLETILPKKTTFDNYEVEHDFASIGKRIMLLNARQIQRVSGKEGIILLAIEDITERKHIEEALKISSTSLQQRASELEVAKNESESFAYSVSHDLRTPLRAINGFSQALLEDYDDKLDVQGKDYLRRVRAATQMMAQLIDDMLKLSGVTRMEINAEKVNLTQIAWSVIDKLQKSQPERLINIKIADGLEDTADSKLMRIVLENLLGNAWKFSGKQSEAVIEFGSTKKGEKKVYFIRDNGAGFDMAYADKLFAPFQRLHTAEEYPGTGIGLATVQRIIQRHGGKVWARGQVDKGATFYFSLQG